MNVKSHFDDELIGTLKHNAAEAGISSFKKEDLMRRYWVIAPQHATRPECWERAWKYDLANNIISLGWNKLGDISHLSEEQLRELIDRTYQKNKPGSKSYILRSL